MLLTGESPADRHEHAVLRSPRTLIVGAGQRRGIARAVGGLGQSVLVCTDPRMAADPEFAVLVADLEAAGLTVTVFGEVESELPESSVRACADRVRPAAPEVVLGIGGGSCIDHAKVVAALLAHGGTPSDYYGENRVPGPVLPVVAVPTTAGTGSEATPVAVLTDAARPTKVGISSPHLIPHTAVVDSELTLGCPPALTAHSGADALAHCVESYTAVRRPATPDLPYDRVFVGAGTLTDDYAMAGLQLIGRSLVRAVKDGADAPARSDLALAALYGGFALGTAGTAAAHAIQYPVGALTKTAHGLGVGVLLPYVMEFNLHARIPEMTRIAVALGALDAAVDAVVPTEDTARAGLDAVGAILADIGIPPTLHELGLAETDLPEVVRLAMTGTRLVENNPRELTAEGCASIVRAAFHGDRALARTPR